MTTGTKNAPSAKFIKDLKMALMPFVDKDVLTTDVKNAINEAVKKVVDKHGLSEHFPLDFEITVDEDGTINITDTKETTE